ncbi:hypothetical protein KUCAC02_021233 [Chaenocephalus aceratus]|uniref:Uncharacterized protein n=1 Tax=Chaenocephalus aceratus TaxID=36190 RepID=A0ACB9XFS2_CHAAC|nr:hypothetical protein KUCAC02_021233 [Chaenocephalus aceratus]
MAMESASASVVAAVVAMEMPVVRGALPVVEEDEGYRAPPGSEERLRYRRGGRGRRRRGVPFNRNGHYMLIVVGEIGTEQQLDAVRAHIERAPYHAHYSLDRFRPGCCFQCFQCDSCEGPDCLHICRTRLKAGDTPTY